MRTVHKLYHDDKFRKHTLLFYFLTQEKCASFCCFVIISEPLKFGAVRVFAYNIRRKIENIEESKVGNRISTLNRTIFVLNFLKRFIATSPECCLRAHAPWALFIRAKINISVAEFVRSKSGCFSQAFVLLEPILEFVDLPIANYIVVAALRRLIEHINHVM